LPVHITIDARDGLDARNQLELLLTGGGGLASAAPRGALVGNAAAGPGPVIFVPNDASEEPVVSNGVTMTGLVVEEPKAPAKRGRKAKADEPAAPPPVIEPEVVEDVPADEDEAQEELFPDEDAGDDDTIIGGFAVTPEGLTAAMQAHVAKFGMEATQANMATLCGYAKRSEVVAAGEAAIRAALTRFTRAIETGKAAG
jgi:hypothetical protein